jgi:hypothetical protein
LAAAFQQRALFFVRKGDGHAVDVARTEVMSLTISNEPLTVV